MIIGITRATNKYHIIRATLESLAFQTADVIALMEHSTGLKVSSLSVDGGASANSLLMEFQADISGIPIERPICVETTALGVAYMTGLTLGVYSSLEEIKSNKKTDKRFTPSMDSVLRSEKLDEWHRAVDRTRGWKS